MNNYILNIVKSIKPEYVTKYLAAAIIAPSLMLLLDLSYGQDIFIAKELESEKAQIEGNPEFYEEPKTEE